MNADLASASSSVNANSVGVTQSSDIYARINPSLIGHLQKLVDLRVHFLQEPEEDLNLVLFSS